MVLHGRLCGRVERRQIILAKALTVYNKTVRAFCVCICVQTIVRYSWVLFSASFIHFPQTQYLVSGYGAENPRLLITIVHPFESGVGGISL
jgi:hypothetical protein